MMLNRKQSNRVVVRAWIAGGMGVNLMLKSMSVRLLDGDRRSAADTPWSAEVLKLKQYAA